MAYLNKVMLIGNIGKDPEIRVNQASGKKVVSFSLATSRRYRDDAAAEVGPDGHGTGVRTGGNGHGRT